MLGEAAKNLFPRGAGTKWEDLSDEERKVLEELKKAVPSKNEDGKTMSNQEFADEFYNNQEKYAADFDRLTTKRAVAAHEIKKRWREITDPFQYTDKQPDEKDENGNVVKEGEYKRIKVKREHENWGPLLKRFSKKAESPSVVLSKYINTDYLLGLDSKQKKVLKAYSGAMKDEIVGFSGILMGLPLVVAEPAVGIGFLAQGINSSKRAKETLFGNSTKRKNLQNKYMTADGKYHLVGYAGNSVETMANGMQSAAMENAQDVQRAKREHNRQVVRRTQKHTKFYSALMGTLKLEAGFGATAATLGAISTLPGGLMVAGTIATGTVLTGALGASLRSSAYVGMQDIIRTSRKQSQKDWEDELKSTDSLLKYMADRYYEVEEQKNEFLAQKAEQDVQKGSIEFENAYRVAVESRIEAVDNMPDEELLLETGYDDNIGFNYKDGKRVLTVATRKRLIDQAIIEIAEKSGIINLREFKITDNLEQVKGNIEDRLLAKGIIIKNHELENIMGTDLDKAIKAQKEELEQKRPNAVEEKMIDDSIIEAMQGKANNDGNNTVTPSDITDEEIISRFTEKYKRMAEIPSESSKKVTEELAKKKDNNNQGNSTSEDTSEELQESIRNRELDAEIDRIKDSIIDSRRARLEKRVESRKEKMDDKTRAILRRELNRRKINELDQEIRIKQMTLSGKINPEDTTQRSESFEYESKTEDVIGILKLQEQLYKDIGRFRSASNYKPPEQGKKRLQAYKAEINMKDGTVRLDKFADGSARLDELKDGSRKVNDTSKESTTKIESIQEITRRVRREIRI